MAPGKKSALWLAFSAFRLVRGEVNRFDAEDRPCRANWSLVFEYRDLAPAVVGMVREARRTRRPPV
jgi:hypothetical protein